MEQFHDGHHVWLQSRVHGTYLHADVDGHGVSLSRRRASMKAAWAVHLYGDDQHVLLHSAAYGRYLAATRASAPLGCRGFRVEQRDYDGIEEEAMRWQAQAIEGDFGDRIVLRHAAGVLPLRFGYLRANGRYLPWNENVVSVDPFDNFSTMMEWVVVPIPVRQSVPRLPRPNRVSSPCPLPDSSRIAFAFRRDRSIERIGFLNAVNLYLNLIAGIESSDNFIRLGPILDSVIRLRLAALLPSRDVVLIGFSEGFVFRGRSVFCLRNEVADWLGIRDDLVMYVRAGRYGRFTPLVVDLPRSRQTLVIRVEPPAPANLDRYPDVDAE
ncbi:unnamed protein product [Alopecurus aequalis]